MTIAAANIVRRFLARSFLADDKFRPPKSVVNAVEAGKLDSHVLLFWKDVVEKISTSPQGWKGSPSYGAAIQYWRNKCASNGYPLPKEYIEGLGGPGSQGRWSVKTGDEIEEWVKQTLASQGLVGTLTRTAAEWEMEIQHLERLLADAHARVEKHKDGLEKAKTQKGVAQKQKWLDEALSEILKFSDELEKAKAQVEALGETAAKKAQAESYAIEFEKQFQFMMTVAVKDLGNKSALETVKKAVARFEKGLEIPGPYIEGPSSNPESPDAEMWREQRAKNAGILDYLSGFLVKSWEYMKGAFGYFVDWVSDLAKSTKDIDKLLSEAGA